MAINVFLQNINGAKEDKVVDLYYSLAKLWPIGDSRFPLLQYIDPYGNAIFNGSQMPEVVTELNALMALALSKEQRDVIQGIIDLAIRCQSHPHKFLRFRGD